MAQLILDEEETEKVLEWNTHHLKECHGGEEPYCGAIGGRISYRVGYTSLGSTLRVTCDLCKVQNKKVSEYEHDLTDYGSW
jgi:hypothetical protein